MSASYRFHIYDSICAGKLALTRGHKNSAALPDGASRPMRGIPSQRSVGPWPPPCAVPPRKPIGFRQRTETRMPPTRHTNFHEWNHKTHCLPESAAYLVVDFIDRSANCVAFIWVNQTFVHKAIVIAKVAQIRVAPKGRIRVPRRRHSCPAQCRRPKVVAQWRCTAKVSIVNSLLEGQKGAQTRPSRRCIDSAHRRRSRATCAGFVVARSAPIPLTLHK